MADAQHTQEAHAHVEDVNQLSHGLLAKYRTGSQQFPHALQNGQN